MTERANNPSSFGDPISSRHYAKIKVNLRQKRVRCLQHADSSRLSGAPLEQSVGSLELSQ